MLGSEGRFLLRFGTKVKTRFTIGAGKRYASIMLLVAIAAAVVATPAQDGPRSPAAATAVAQATVRIISGAVLHLDGRPQAADTPASRPATVREDGEAHPARLIEFE